MKTLLLFVLVPALCIAQSDIIPLSKNRSDDTLLAGFASGGKTLTVSATGTLVFATGFTLTGGSVLKSALALELVENTALSTWAGSSNLTTYSGGTFGGAASRAVSAGGYGTADSGKVPLYNSSGLLATTVGVRIVSGSATGNLQALSLSAARAWGLPDATGTIITTGNLGSITSTGTVTSGTWSGLFGAVSGANLTTLNASNISSGSLALARIAQSGATTGQSLRWNGSAWAPTTPSAGGVTSVAATVPSFLSVTGSPVTSSGTLAISLSGTALPEGSGGTGLTSLGAGVGAWLGTPTLINLNAALGVGVAPIASPTFTGTATAPTLVTSSGQLTSPQAASSAVASMDIYAHTGASGYPASGDKWFSWSADVNSVKTEIMKLYAQDATTWRLRGQFGINPNALGPSVDGGTLTFVYGSFGFYQPVTSIPDFVKVYYPFVFANGVYKTRFGNSTNAERVDVINTYTDDTNFESAVIDWQTVTNVLRLGSDVGSAGGTARDVALIHGGAEKARIAAAGFMVGATGTPHSLIKSGTVTLNSGYALVYDSDVIETGSASTASRIIITRMYDGGTPGDSYSVARINGSSFYINAMSLGAGAANDNSTLCWLLINP
jgi:hypothetical protein